MGFPSVFDSTIYMLVALIVILVIVAVILIVVFVRRRRNANSEEPEDFIPDDGPDGPGAGDGSYQAGHSHTDNSETGYVSGDGSSDDGGVYKGKHTR
ncbi:MAG: hypothetical protein ACOYIK_08500 [Coriobacteriales bacterium]|jgi:hypothetical protein